MHLFLFHYLCSSYEQAFFKTEMDRRKFIRNSSLAGMSLLNFEAGRQLLQLIADYRHIKDSHQDENFWRLVRQAFYTTPGFINLNNAGVSPQSRQVQEAESRYLEYSNEAPSFYMWRSLDKNREPIRARLAEMAGADPEEVAINRNATEALDTVIFGLNLKKGDEVVLCRQDYPLMIHAWRQREAREGIVLKWVDLNLPVEDEEFLIQAYTSLFSPQTRVLHLTHMINWTGQILPAKAIAEKARARGIRVLLDAAQSFAQLDIKIAELGADYAGTSLHKWLCAPFGTGMLYVKKDRISDLWPLFPTEEPLGPDIRKFENLGTRSTPAEMAIGPAIEFHHMIGSQRKARRLEYLKNYWTEQVKDLPRLKLHSSLDPRFGGAIVNFSIEGMDYRELSNRLHKEHRIHVSPVKWTGIEGVRATPQVYTSLEELDRLVMAISKLTGGSN